MLIIDAKITSEYGIELPFGKSENVFIISYVSLFSLE